jgi:hypothetical protein
VEDRRKKRRNATPIPLPPLDEQQQVDLQQRSKEAPDAETRTRYQMIVLAQLGHTAPHIAIMVLRSEDTVARSQAGGRVAIIIADNLKTHTAEGSLLVRRMLTELSDQLSLVYTPAYDPDANRIEWRCAHLTPSRDTQSSSQRL